MLPPPLSLRGKKRIKVSGQWVAISGPELGELPVTSVHVSLATTMSHETPLSWHGEWEVKALPGQLPY